MVPLVSFLMLQDRQSCFESPPQGIKILDVFCRNTPSLQAALKESKDLQIYEDKLVWIEEPVTNNISSSKLRELLQRVSSPACLLLKPTAQV